jgi:hypothetical protein
MSLESSAVFVASFLLGGSGHYYEGPNILSLQMYMLGKTLVRAVGLVCSGNVAIGNVSPLHQLHALGPTGVDAGEYSSVLLSGDLWAMECILV